MKFYICLNFRLICTFKSNHTASRPDILQNAQVPVWSNRECQDSYDKQKKSQTIRPTQMCAGKKMGGVDSCWVILFGFIQFEMHFKCIIFFYQIQKNYVRI